MANTAVSVTLGVIAFGLSLGLAYTCRKIRRRRYLAPSLDDLDNMTEEFEMDMPYMMPTPLLHFVTEQGGSFHEW